MSFCSKNQKSLLHLFKVIKNVYYKSSCPKLLSKHVYKVQINNTTENIYMSLHGLKHASHKNIKLLLSFYNILFQNCCFYIIIEYIKSKIIKYSYYFKFLISICVELFCVGLICDLHQTIKKPLFYFSSVINSLDNPVR